MPEHLHRPGSTVPHSGVYLVIHQKHRPTHEAILVEGQKFPDCAHCGAAVRFKLLSAAQSIEKDSDFRKRRAHASR